MTLPASGTITWGQICTEFSLNPVTAVWPTNFYGLGGAPAAGNLGFADFYGRSAAAGSFTPVPGTYTYWDNGQIGGGAGGSALITSIGGSVAWSYSISGFAATPSISSGSSAASISFNVPAGVSLRTSTITLTQGANTWNLTVKASGSGDPGGGACVTCDSLILMADGTEKPAGELQPGDVVHTHHELTGELGNYEVTNVQFAHDTVYSRRGYPDATRNHRFGFWLLGMRWYRASRLGKRSHVSGVAKITVMGAHTYMARHPSPGSKWRLCHNIKP